MIILYNPHLDSLAPLVMYRAQDIDAELLWLNWGEDFFPQTI